MTRRLTALALLALAASPLHAQQAEGTTYAFLVACSDYEDGEHLKTLPFTVKETDEFRKALIEGGVKADDIKFLRDGADDKRFLPKKKNVLAELERVLARLKPEDALIVALDGHGIQPVGAKTGYFCPANADISDLKTCIPLEGDTGLYQMLKAAAPKRKLLLVNACRNDPKTTQAANKVDFDPSYKFAAPEGIAALFSCRPGEFTFYYPAKDKVRASPGLERSLFFHHLITAWQGGYSGGKRVTLEDVFREVQERTAKEADQLLGERQNPVAQRGYTGDWVVRPAGKSGSIPATPPALAGDAVRAKLEAEKEAYEEEVKKFRDAVGKYLDERERKARDIPDKKLVDQVVAERKAFEDGGELPKGLPATVRAQVASAKTRMEAAYKAASNAYVKARKDDEANAVEKGLEEFKKGTAAAADPFPVGSVWVAEGNTPFVIQVTERKGETFRAKFTMGNSFEQSLFGTIKNNRFAWLAKDVRVIKGQPSGKKDNFGTITGNSVEVTWKDPAGKEPNKEFGPMTYTRGKDR